jgi:hypothetical protein
MLNKASSNRVAKALTVFTHAAVRPGWTVRALGRLYNDICVGRATIPTISIGRLLPPDGRITLLDVVGEDGNMSTEEVVALSGLVRATSPHTILEIGTFNGNTTLQLAANSPETCTVYTLDLPVGSEADPRTEANDEHYVKSDLRRRPRYLDSPFAGKVRQVYGNSMEVNFRQVCDERRADIVFIDGGHSYECVASDTQRAFDAVAVGGIVAWHDYTTAWPGVVNFLDEFAQQKPLVRVAGTTLVIHDTTGRLHAAPRDRS